MPNDVFILKGKHVRTLFYFHVSMMVQVTSPTIGCLRKDGWPRSVTTAEQVLLPLVSETVCPRLLFPSLAIRRKSHWPRTSGTPH